MKHNSIVAILGWLFSPYFYNTQPVVAQVEWVRIDNSLNGINKRGLFQTGLKIEKIMGQVNFNNAIKSLGNGPSLIVGKVIISNESDSRSQTIELGINDGIVFMRPYAEGAKAAFSKLTWAHIEPNETIEVNFASTSGFLFTHNLKSQISIIHNERKVDLYGTQITGEIAGIFPFYRTIVVQYPLLVMIALVIAATIALPLIFGVIFFNFCKGPISFQARIAKKKDVKQQLDLIKYIETKYPEKLPDGYIPSSET
jgi:hypothetical protein